MTKYIACDLETTGLDTVRGHGSIHCIGLVNEDYDIVLEWGQYAQQELERLLDGGVVLVFHHAEYDIATLRSLTTLDIKPGQFVCTQVLAHAINPQLPSYSLDNLTGGQKMDYKAAMLSAGLWDGKDLSTLYAVGFSEVMREYCLQDTHLAWQLWQEYIPHLKKDARLANSYFNILMPFVEVMMSMQQGMEIDATAMMALLVDITTEINEKYAKFVLDYPQTPKFKWDDSIKMWHPTGEWKEPSLASPNDVNSLLFSHGWEPDDFKRDTGRPVTSQAVLKRITATETNPPALRKLAGDMSDIKSLVGIQTQCISMLEIITATQSTRVYANWHQTGTVTHRLSSSSPNMQNVSTRHPKWGKRMRACFVPPVGYSMLVGDLSQIELAILAYYLELFCGDSRMADAARAEKDFHSANAENWLNAKPEDADFKAKRTICKNGIFAASYGAAAKRLSLTINVSIEEAMEILRVVSKNTEADQLKEIFWATLSSTRDVLPVSHGYRKCRSGFFYDVVGVRHFYPNITSSDRYESSSAKRQSFNALFQGGCFSIFASLCNKLYPRIQAVGGWICALVHDEILFVVPTSEKENLLSLANEVFTSYRMYTPQGGVPVRAEFSIVNNWSEKK